MTTANILGNILFGSIGFVAFIYGKKLMSFRHMMLGLALAFFPYAVQDTMSMYVIGSLLTAALFFWRD